MSKVDKFRTIAFDRALKRVSDAFAESVIETRAEILKDVPDNEKPQVRAQFNKFVTEMVGHVKLHDWHKRDNKVTASFERSPISMMKLAVETYRRGHKAEAQDLFAFAALNIDDFLQQDTTVEALPVVAAPVVEQPKPAPRVHPLLVAVKKLIQAGKYEEASTVLAAEKRVYVAMDGDNIGASAERAAMSDDLNQIVEVEKVIRGGQEVLRQWAVLNDGVIYLDGGDDISMSLPEEKLGGLEQLRADYKASTGYTITIGIGDKFSQAVIAMMYGKLNGKDQLNKWSDELQAKYDEQKKDETPKEKYQKEGLV